MKGGGRLASMLLGIMFIMWILTAFPIMMVANKLGVSHSWMAWLPIIQLVLLMRMANKPWWIALLSLLPLVGTFVSIGIWVYCWVEISKMLDEHPVLGLLTALPLVSLIVLWKFAFKQPPRIVTDT